LLPDKGPRVSRCGSDKDSLHGAEKKALLLGQLYVVLTVCGHRFVNVIVQLMYCLVLCCVVAVVALMAFASTRFTY
jgi:hypothetical protein